MKSVSPPAKSASCGGSGANPLQPGVLSGRCQKRLQVITPLRRRGLIRLDAGVVAAVEQQWSRFDLGYLREGLHRAEHHEVVAAVVHRSHSAVDVSERSVDDGRAQMRGAPVDTRELVRLLRAEPRRYVLLTLGQHVDAEFPAGLDGLP